MMQLIPLPNTSPNIDFSAQLGTINYKFHLFQNTEGVFISVSQAGTAILNSAPCRDRVRIVRDAYLGFSGDLSFFDTQGTSDPNDYTQWGTRYVLAWIEPGEVVA